MNLLDLVRTKVLCLLRGHNMHQIGYMEYCKRCWKTWWDLP